MSEKDIDLYINPDTDYKRSRAESKQTRMDNLSKLIGWQKGCLECYHSEIHNFRIRVAELEEDISHTECQVDDLERELKYNNHVLECMESDIVGKEEENE